MLINANTAPWTGVEGRFTQTSFIKYETCFSLVLLPVRDALSSWGQGIRLHH